MLGKALIQSASGSASAESQLYVDDVFSTYLYTGNGSTQTITNGIDLAGEGGLVWTKSRGAATNHNLWDVANGTVLASDNTTAAGSATTYALTANSDGYNLGNGQAQTNSTSFGPYASWTFRKAPKFFDVVTFTQSGVSGWQTVNHSLGAIPGMIILKNATTGTTYWNVYHRYNSAKKLFLNSTSAEITETIVQNLTSASFDFSITNVGNNNGDTFVAYLFAHDTDTDGIIQCGSYTTDSSGNATVDLGWEPQYLMYKNLGAGNNWTILDSMRGLTADSSNRELMANTSGVEGGGSEVDVTATGFKWGPTSPSNTYIYLAIRRPNKPPTTGTQVYNAIARTGTGAAAEITGVGFTPDMVHIKARETVTTYGVGTALLGRAASLATTHTSNDGTTNPPLIDKDIISFDIDGIRLGTEWRSPLNSSSYTYINHFFRRAPGFFDVVCYTGTGVTGSTVNHNLGVVPELIIFKDRNPGSSPRGNWFTYVSSLGKNLALALNLTNPQDSVINCFGNAVPTSTVFYTGYDDDGWQTGSGGQPYVAYLFATLPGISKVGSYTGNGTNQTIDCGFSTGARFILIKRTDSTGDWLVADSVRGIVSGSDPYLELNTTNAEVTSEDWLDPANEGFIVNEVSGSNANTNGATYIFLAIA